MMANKIFIVLVLLLTGVKVNADSHYGSAFYHPEKAVYQYSVPVEIEQLFMGPAGMQICTRRNHSSRECTGA
jgi:hypothetical protein